MKLKPVIPFEPVRTEHFPEGPQWAAQVKWDGVRVLTYYDGREVRLLNRKLNERTFHYPELANVSEYCSARSAVLDGEIIAFRDGKPSFYQVMKRDGVRNFSNVKALQDRVPVVYMLFDILFLNGEWVTARSLAERQNMLAEIIKPADHVQLTENFDDPKALYEIVKEKEMEGVVVKDLSSSYVIRGKDNRWQKKKFYRDLIAVVGGVTFRGGIVNSLLLGLFDPDGRLWYVGHAGTGRLTQEDWRQFTRRIKPLIQPAMPFANLPPRQKEAVWLKPELAVKVKFAEWTDGHTLRHPSIQAFVDANSHKRPNSP